MAMFTAIGTALGASGAAATWLGVGATAAVAAAGYGAATMMSQPKSTGAKQLTQMPQAPSAPKQDDASKKAALTLEQKKRNMARSKSVQTNPLGIKDEAEVARKKLLGG